MLKHTHMNIYHAQMQSSIIHSGNIIHLSQHSFNMFISYSLTDITVAEVKWTDHLSYEELLPQPATSLQRSTQP